MCSAQPWDALSKDENPVFTFIVNDTLNFPVFVVESPLDNSTYYASRLQTNVCNDQICLPIEVNLFWDLLGNYHHFSKEDRFNFTKFDHQYFDKDDYALLHDILSDSLSLLRDYAVEDLLEKEPKISSVQIDAVTRPTAVLFSNVTVPGALYTVYTLWHIANGPIKQKLHEHSENVYKERNWQTYFASSNVPDYQEYFLKHLDTATVVEYKDQIINLLLVEDEFIPHYAIDLLRTNVFQDPVQYNPILQILEKLKAHVVTEILSSISAGNKETKTILRNFKENPRSSSKHKEIINKILKNEE